MITRFAVLPDSRGILLGIDKADIFEKGMVYEATEFDGEIVLRKVGKYSLPKNGSYPSEQSTNQDIIHSGLHLLTQEEHDKFMITPDTVIAKRKQGEELNEVEIKVIKRYITEDYDGGHYVVSKEVNDLFQDEIREVEVENDIDVWYDEEKRD